MATYLHLQSQSAMVDESLLYSYLACPFSHLIFLIHRPFPLLETHVITQIIRDALPPQGTCYHICKYLLVCHVTYLQVLGIKAWASLGTVILPTILASRLSVILFQEENVHPSYSGKLICSVNVSLKVLRNSILLQ